jgi:hypothetical protein
MLTLSRRWFLSVVTFFVATLTTASTAAGEESVALQTIAVEHYADKYRLSLEDARARLAVQDQAAGIEDRLTALLGDQWADMWYDAADRGRLKIGITRAASARREEIQTLLREQGVEEHTDLVTVTYTLAELESKQDALRSSLMDMIMRGHARTSRNPMLNRVIVTAVTNLPASEEERIRQAASTPGVTMRRVNARDLIGQFEACHTAPCDPPLRGGVRLYPPSGNYFGNFCTLGFTARHRVHTSHVLAMTAGHCVYEAWHFTNVWDAAAENGLGAEAIGPSYGFVLGGAPGVDAGVVLVNSSGFWGTPVPPAPVVLVESSSMTTYDPNYAIRQDAKSTLGQILCMTGTITLTHCAFVSELGADHVFQVSTGIVLLKNLGELATCHTLPQDSGAPIYKNHKAYGIHVGKRSYDVCHTMYQGIRGAENELNVDILLAP